MEPPARTLRLRITSVVHAVSFFFSGGRQVQSRRADSHLKTLRRIGELAGIPTESEREGVLRRQCWISEHRSSCESASAGMKDIGESGQPRIRWIPTLSIDIGFTCSSSGEYEVHIEHVSLLNGLFMLTTGLREADTRMLRACEKEAPAHIPKEAWNRRVGIHR